MSGLSRDPAAALRGSAAGLLTAALTVAAHGVASGAPPTGSIIVALTVLAATIGALATTLTRAADARVLLGLLAAGQLLGHLTLSTTGHSHAPAGTSPAPMLAAHVIAVVVGAVLIAASGRLCAAVSRVLRVAVRMTPGPVLVGGTVALRGADHPLRSMLLLAASVSHRGPPDGQLR